MFTNRRSVLAGLALSVATPIAMAQAAKTTAKTMADKATEGKAASVALPSLTAIDLSTVKTADQYYGHVLGRAELSLATSQIAVNLATQKNAHEFAGFELGEAITVNKVLKSLGATAPAMDGPANEALASIKGASKGTEFDKAYIALQLVNHEDLRDLADAYLQNSVAMTDPKELEGQHLASLMLAVFKEHVAICKRITAELQA
jgi:predicted outer membrane protein